MPPKGWRKNGESSQLPKDAELVSIDDILFPRSTIQKLAKGILNPADSSNTDNMSLTKDSLIAVQRSATVFVSHLMFHARQIARDAGRKNVNSQDIIYALERADLAGFSPEIKQKLSTFETDADAKKKSKADAREAHDVDEQPASKKMKDNSSKTVSKAEDDEEDDDDDTEALEDDAEEALPDDATVSPANEEEDEEETVANPIALLAQEEEELGGLEPQEQADGAQETEEE